MKKMKETRKDEQNFGIIFQPLEINMRKTL